MLSDHAPDEELFPIEDQSIAGAGSSVFEYTDSSLVSGVLKGVVVGSLELVKQLVNSGKSVNINDNKGNTPLHVAVLLSRSDMVDFFLTCDELNLDNQNFFGETALLLACRSGKIELAQKLIGKGANVNMPDSYGRTPLHYTMKNPKLGQLLIENGANTDVADSNGNMPLHLAVIGNCVETVSMLLYYNAEPNCPADCNFTPFLLAVAVSYEELQNVLVNFVDELDVEEAFYKSLFENCFDVVALAHTMMSYDVVMFDIAGKMELSYFIGCIRMHGGNEDIVTQFACTLLMYGYQLTADDIFLLYRIFGRNELMKIFLYMDFEDATNRYDCTLMPFLLCSLNYNNIYRLNLGLNQLQEFEDYFEFQFSDIVLQTFESRYGKNDTLPKLPSLLDLANRSAKQYIIKKNDIRNTCQYYTFVDQMNIAEVYRHILKHEHRIYHFQRCVRRKNERLTL
nr:unnamed protein product [Callosobruchus chinensis]